MNCFGLDEVNSKIACCAVIRHNVTEVKKIPRILNSQFPRKGRNDLLPALFSTV